MSIRIVVHCYAAELPQFAVFLRHQLSSLALWPPRTVPCTIEICYHPDDVRTREVIDWFVCNTRVNIDVHPILTPERLFRRAIGRNDAALSSSEELIWFSDCDYLFGEGCVDGLWKSWNELSEFVSMVFPGRFWTMKSRAIGDELIEQDDDGGLESWFTMDSFQQVRAKKAFGGLQIVPGSLARKHGYLDGHCRYQKPLSKPFANFHDDVAFRKAMLRIGPIIPIDVPRLYRIRHSKSTYAGAPENVHGKILD